MAELFWDLLSLPEPLEDLIGAESELKIQITLAVGVPVTAPPKVQRKNGNGNRIGKENSLVTVDHNVC